LEGVIGTIASAVIGPGKRPDVATEAAAQHRLTGFRLKKVVERLSR
jgi:hypothetical protein